MDHHALRHEQQTYQAEKQRVIGWTRLASGARSRQETDERHFYNPQ